MAGQPADPGTPLTDAAAQLHELYLSLQAAGFGEPQALYLCGQVVAAQTKT